MGVYFYGCVTLDGYLADKNHGLDWLYQTGTIEETGYNSFYEKMNITIMGKRTFDEVAKMKKCSSRVSYNRELCFYPCRKTVGQWQGYGRAIITHAIERAKSLGHRAIVLGGFPYHYAPYGFVGTKKYNITMDDGKFYTGIMALPLYDGALDGITGKIQFSEALYPDESGLEAFDATFPPMEKRTLPCQKEFELAAAELDEREYE